MVYKVKTGKFEGPFGALLDMVEEKKLAINEISLAEVCQDYLNYLKSQINMPRAETASFLTVGATLMLIKSRSLIPSFELTEEEEESIEELEMKLKLLKEFRVLAKNFEYLAKAKQSLFSRQALLGYNFGFLPPDKINIEFLREIQKRLIDSFPVPDLLPQKTLAKIITIEQKARDIISRIQSRIFGTLDKIISAKNKSELIVGFLAILELIKQGFLDVEQKNLFGEVEIKKN
ncbi:MAG: segregation/condensation protein A [Patescibacteria group bacterium]